MSLIPVEPLFLTNYKATVDGDDYEAALDTLEFVPSSTVATWTGGDGKTHSATTPATWVCNAGFAQDPKNPESFGRFLHDNEGLSFPVIFTPINLDPESPTITATITATPGRIGGTVGAFAGATVSLGSSRPEYVDVP